MHQCFYGGVLETFFFGGEGTGLESKLEGSWHDGTRKESRVIREDESAAPVKRGNLKLNAASGLLPHYLGRVG